MESEAYELISAVFLEIEHREQYFGCFTEDTILSSQSRVGLLSDGYKLILKELKLQGHTDKSAAEWMSQYVYLVNFPVGYNQ